MNADESLAYAAGYFDGEGSVWMKKKGLQLTVRVVSRDKESIAVLAEVLGGKVLPTVRVWKGRTLRNYWSWSAYGKEGQKALRKLLPLLLGKREVAIAACSFDYSGSRLSDDERKRRVEFSNRPIYTCDHWESGETRGKPGNPGTDGTYPKF